MEWTFDMTLKNRQLFAHFLKHYSLEQLNTVPKDYRNSIFWNIAHSVVTQQMMVYKLSGLKPLISEDLINTYKKGTKTEHEATQEEIDHIKSLLFSTHEQTVTDFNTGKFKTFKAYTVSTNSTLTNVEEALAFNVFHEGIHLGYILAMKNSL